MVCPWYPLLPASSPPGAFDVTAHGVLFEARLGIIMASLKAEQEAAQAGAPSMQQAIIRLVKKRLSNLILLPLDQVDEGKLLRGLCSRHHGRLGVLLLVLGHIPGRLALFGFDEPAEEADHFGGVCGGEGVSECCEVE
ncbi:hypothetical protein PG994_004092 [Apiospora phragmitis]|uniref:Uncharacterized protein n=1 Tax=Apiospora phragmitis TaxID=2905665 RepID=A0ABR1VPR0_9PEZI